MELRQEALGWGRGGGGGCLELKFQCSVLAELAKIYPLEGGLLSCVCAFAPWGKWDWFWNELSLGGQGGAQSGIRQDLRGADWIWGLGSVHI